MPRDPDEYEQHLAVQYGFLQISADASDRGRQSEAIRLAATLRVLVYDRGRSVSLLTQLGRRHDFEILNTIGDRVPNDPTSPWIPLLCLNIGGPPVFMPRLFHDHGAAGRQSQPPEPQSNEAEWASVDDWLQRVVIREPGSGHEFSALDLILHLANKDGGAHVDPDLPADYHRLSRLNSLGFGYQYMPWGGGSVTIGDPFFSNAAESPVPATVRQLAFEMMWSLHHSFGFEQPTTELEVHRSGICRSDGRFW